MKGLSRKHIDGAAGAETLWQTMKRWQYARFLLDDFPSVILGILLIVHDFESLETQNELASGEFANASGSNQELDQEAQIWADVMLIAVSTVYSLLVVLYFIVMKVAVAGGVASSGIPPVSV